ncbi:hypothetical protein Gasu2_70340 [Galdieria sulphuraria]|nr:hypothetical protein Gasu2_70340 [Galdieria sulphuraria]
MLSEANCNVSFDSRMTALEQVVKNSPDTDCLRHSFVSFGKWVCQNPPHKEDSVEQYIDRYCRLLEYSLVQRQATSEFLLCLGLLILCQPNISAKRKADWSKKVSQCILINNCSEFLLYSLVYSYLQHSSVSSSISFYNCMEDNIRLLSKLSSIVESASESSTVLSDILPLLLSLQSLTSLQKHASIPVGLRADGLCGLFSEFSCFLSKILHFLRERHPSSISDHKRLENGICALLFVAFGLQWLDICHTYELWIGKKLGYQMLSILFEHNLFQGQSSDTLLFFILIQSEVVRWYKQAIEPSDLEVDRMDFTNDVMEGVHHRIESKYQQDGEYGSLLWALKTFQLYHQSIFYSLERDQQVIEKRNALDRWLLTFCERIEQIPTLCFLRNSLSRCKKCLMHPSERKTLPISSSMNDISITTSEKEIFVGEIDPRAVKRTRRDHSEDESNRTTHSKLWKIVHQSTPVDIVPVEDMGESNSRIHLPNEKNLVLQRMDNVEISSFPVVEHHRVDRQEEVDDDVDQNDNQESVFQDENQSSYSDVDVIVNEIDLEITSLK